MAIVIRAAGSEDLAEMVGLLLAGAAEAGAVNPAIWRVTAGARGEVAAALGAVLEAEAPAFGQSSWLVAEHDDRLAGLAHVMHVPVPPIYAGDSGAPGLILDDCALAGDAPEGPAEALIAAAEAGLRDAGARIVLGACRAGSAWQAVLAGRGFAPLTLYLGKGGLGDATAAPGLRGAGAADVPGIVALSAVNREVLAALDPFWAVHLEADVRFGAWMRRSLTLGDRDTLVSQDGGRMTGYAIAQPATRLHFPAAFDIEKVGIIDDYFHDDFADPSILAEEGAGAEALLRAAEAGLARRGGEAALVVCPAAWTSKIAVLERAGYGPGLLWMIQRSADGVTCAGRGP